MASNPEETITLGIAIALVVCLIAALYFLPSLKYRKLCRERYEHGKQMGALVAKDIGCKKAYKIAEQLPDSPYRDGYVEGVAAIEDAMQRGL